MAFGNDTSVYISTLYRAKANLKSYFFVYLEFGIFSTLSISDMQQDSLQKISSNSRRINTPVLLYEECGHIVPLNIFGSLFLKSYHQNLVVFQCYSKDSVKSCTNKQRKGTYYFVRPSLAHHDRHGLRTPGEEVAFTARPKFKSQSQIFRYGRSIFCLPYQPKISDFFDLCLHWVSVVRDDREQTC